MLNRFKIFVMAVFVLLMLSQPAMSREFADIYSDCGIGAMIAPRNSGVAGATNITWDSGTTAISSNISSPDTCNGGQEKMAAFIYDSYDSIEKDLASGSGTYLDTLTALTGYTPDVQQKFKEALRNDFAKMVANSNYTDQSRFEKAEAFYNLIYKHLEADSSGSYSVKI